MVTSPESVVMPINDETVLTCEMNLLPDKFQWKHYPLNIRDASNPKAAIILGTAYAIDLPATMFTSDKKVSTLKIKSSSKSVAGDYQCLAHYGASVIASIPGRITITTLGKFASQNSLQVNVVAGNTLLWRCDFPQSNPPAYIDYYKNGDYVNPEILTGTHSLIIPSLNPSHSGKYSCTANNVIQQSSLNADFNLNLKVLTDGPTQAPKFLIAPTKYYTVNSKDSVFLECSAVGNPVPKVYWFKSNSQLPQNRTKLYPGGLQIINVTSNDDGVYVCNHTNAAGTISHHITLVYNEAPTIEDAPKNTDIKEGENLDLECLVKGTPEPKISWFLNGETVINDTHIEAIGNRIYFRPVEKKHAGTLQCFATNVVGTDYSSFNLKVIPKQISSTDVFEELLTQQPTIAVHKRRKHHKTKKNRGQKGTTEMIPPSRPTVTRLNDESVMVRWTVPENNGLPIQFFKVQYRELGPINHNGTHKGSKWKTTNADIPPHIRSYEVNNLNPDHAYKFRIAAVYSNNDNKLGPNSVKFHLTRADFFIRNPLTVPRLIHTEMVNETAIRIHWEYIPSPNASIEGFFIHYVPADSASDYMKTAVEGGNITSYVIRHLQPGTMYDIKMQSFTTKSASEFSPIMKQNTAFATKKHTAKESPVVVATTAETPSETTGDSQMYIFIGAGVLSVALLLSVIVLIIIFKKRKQKKESSPDASRADKDDASHHIQADSNEYVVSPKTVNRVKNGNVPSNNRITITPNPLADADNKVTTITIVLLATTVCHVISNPVRDEIKIPLEVASNPYEVNRLTYDYSTENNSNENNFERSLSYIDQTVKEVEAILKSNASLPRLTRGEILEIIENITRADLAAAQKQKNGERTQKAVMLVMPYTPNNNDDSKMQELYTKPPVTKIIDSQNSVTSQTKSTRRPQRKQDVSKVSVAPQLKVSKNKTGEVQNIKVNTAFLPTLKPMVHTQKPLPLKSSTHSETSSTKLYRSSSQPTLTTSTEVSVKQHFRTNIIRRRRPTQQPQRHPNHKYPEETSLSTTNIISSPIPYTTLKPAKFTYQTVADAKPLRPHSFTTAKPLLLEVPLPDELKSTLDELNIGDSFSRNPIKYNFFNLPNTDDNIATNHELPPVKPSVPDISVVADTLTPDMKELLTNFGLLADAHQAVTNFKEEPFIGASIAEVRPDSYVQFKPLPDIGEPSEEMEEFLGRFGLGKSAQNNRKQKQYVQDPNDVLNEAPEIEFQMLPDSLREMVKDMGFSNREGKKMREEEIINAVSNDKNVKTENGNKPKKQHIFNPMETPYASQEEIDKLNQLMDIIKQLEKLNGTANDDDLNTIDLNHIHDLVSSLNKNNPESLDKQKGAPNPINFDLGLIKNEIKRQENSTTSTPEPTTTVTTLEETQTPNLKDLEDSFGGSANGEPEVTVTIPPPTQAPKTGFYYLLDWNSFLDIDDQKGKRVNLRLQPKAGNPQDFISVSVP
ncbi:hypothetical protein FQR65_LT11938 [Abscondita terminalis]|nr:hypothetical protein FQR65_LT11938 [Abscondita terminalis]